MHYYFLWAIVLISHGVEYEFFGNAKGIKVYYENGTPMSFADYKIYSPDGKIFAEGMTDKKGRFLFMPDKKGRWKIEVDDGMGHGFVKTFNIENPEKPLFTQKGNIPFYFKFITGISLIIGFTGIFFYITARKKYAHT